MRKAILLLLVTMTSCATYRAQPLEKLPQDSFKEVSSNFFVGYKKFTPSEEKRYLGKNFISTCYDAIQLTFENSSDNRYEFVEKSSTLPTVDALTVYKKARFSPTGRFLGYTFIFPLAATGVTGLISHETFNFAHYVYFTWAFYGVIFGAIDAGCAIYANHKMLNDYLQKSPECLAIHPKTTVRTLFFVKKKDFHENFSFKLKEEPSGALVEVSL